MKKNFILLFALLFSFKYVHANDFLIGGIYKHNKETFEISKYNFLSKDIKIRFFINSDEDFNSKITIQNGKIDEIIENVDFKKGSNIIPGRDNWIELKANDSIKFTFEDKNKKKHYVYFNKLDLAKTSNLIKEFKKVNKKNEKIIKNENNLKRTASNFSDDNIRLLAIKSPGLKKIKTRNSGVKIFKKFSDSVVLITDGENFGTGSFIDDNKILTNWHVVKDKKSVTIYFQPQTFEKIDFNKGYIARVTKVDEKKDLAILKVNINRGMKKIPLGSISDVEVASAVHAIGHPSGNIWSYSKGTISQLRVDYEWELDNKHIADVIQTQTPISPGSSGGPLISDNGKLIGVNTFITTGGESQNINFAISITSINEFLKSSIDYVKADDATKNNSNVKEIYLDIDGDGYKETIQIDSNNDGIIDIISVDTDKDGFTDSEAIDIDFDGKTDLLKTKKTFDGNTFMIIVADTNRDGIIDAKDKKGIDYDLDGEIDEIFPGTG